MSYELSLHSSPGVDAPEQSLIVDLQSRLSDIPGCEFISHEPDPAFARWFLEEDAFPSEPALRSEFESYCTERGWVTDLTNESATAFWHHKEGVHLASISMPREDDGCAMAYAALVRFASTHQLRVTDPQHGSDIDHSAPGQFPPMWK